MNAAEYDNLERLEQAHWYYAGKRDIVWGWIERVRPPRRDDLLLDCGAGTGRFAQEMEGRCRVLVLDDHEEALRLLRRRFRAEQILSLAGDRVPLPDGSLEYTTALDVLEHTPDDRAVVAGFHRLLKPGGVAVVTVPAGMALWSDWDVALHHYRRYSRRQLAGLFPAEQWEILHVNYTNAFIYPAAWLARRWRRWFPMAPGEKRPEDRMPPPPLNALLRGLFVRQAFWRLPMPFGVSLLLVARKRGAGG
ncbi:MAG: methyltransferase domain-containing protein [Opitutaceae bacterium]|nr:methyltransferase domain-containing protein [Opitutaceae bacterium]